MKNLLLAAPLALGTSTVSAITVNIQVTAHEICSYANGSAQAIVSGGVPPYTYVWSTGATTSSVSGLSAGPVSVTVTDSQSDEATANSIIQSNGYQVNAITSGSMCPGDPYGGFMVMADLPANGPLTFSTPFFTDTTDWGERLYFAFYTAPYGPNIQITADFTDANGCAGVLSTGNRPGQPIWTTAVLLDVQGACAGGANGSIQALVLHSPTYAWTHHQLTDGAGNVFGPDGAIVGPGSGALGHTWTATYDRIVTWYGLAAGTYWLTQVTTYAPFTNWYPSAGCGDSVQVIVPDLGASCASISGTVFMDYNEDCVKSGFEPGRANTLLQFDPGPYFASTGANGVYSLNVPTGTYTVTEITSNAQQHCLPEPITVNADGLVVLDLADTSLTGLDVQLTMASDAARPGFELAYAIDMANLTSGATGNNQVVMTFDPLLSFLDASTSPSSTTSNSLTWNNVGQMNNFDTRDLLVRFQVPSDVGLIGTNLSATATVTPAMADVLPANNTGVWSVTITGSYDPNDKMANTSHGNSNTVFLIDEDEWVDYTIRFQNTGTDTAFLVQITDTLPPHLDPTTIRMGAGSHNFSWSLSGQGILRWVFPNILLPDSNVNEPLSHGFVTFRIRPHEPVLPGTVIENIANIYFDYNPPVITEPSVLVAEFSTGVSRVNTDLISAFPNPAEDRLWLMGASSATNGWSLTSADGRVLITSRNAFPKDGLSLMGLAEGSYCLRVNTATGTTSIRFIKLQ